MKKLFRALAFFLCILFVTALCVPAMAAESLTVEQVQLSPPDMDFYVYSDGVDMSGITKDDVSATVGSYTFDVDSVKAQDRDTDGIFYAFLLDISGSIPQSSLDAAIRSISRIADGMGSDDKLAVITFGDKVRVISDGSRRPADTLKALKGLKAKDQTTKFYTAMDKLISVSKKAKGMRTVAIVVSDGVDDTDAGMTERQLTDTLKNSGIAVYAMQVGKVTKGQTSHLKKFIKVSGGEVYRFSEDNATKVVNSLVGHIDDVVAIHLAGEKDIKVKDGDEITLIVKGFAPVRWKIDQKSWETAAKVNPGQGKKAEEAEEGAEQAAAQKAAADKRMAEELKQQRRMLIIAIAAVILVAVVVVAILLVIRRKNIMRSYYKMHGIDKDTVENLNKEIKKKRRMK
ncbi:MAG: VWA domain-containing protein [Lachnospiraceae bacterium]|nr:VWA domain-containing protein [Lachnospiraceae bacterium]